MSPHATDTFLPTDPTHSTRSPSGLISCTGRQIANPAYLHLLELLSHPERPASSAQSVRSRRNICLARHTEARNRYGNGMRSRTSAPYRGFDGALSRGSDLERARSRPEAIASRRRSSWKSAPIFAKACKFMIDGLEVSTSVSGRSLVAEVRVEFENDVPARDHDAAASFAERARAFKRRPQARASRVLTEDRARPLAEPNRVLRPTPAKSSTKNSPPRPRRSRRTPWCLLVFFVVKSAMGKESFGRTGFARRNSRFRHRRACFRHGRLDRPRHETQMPIEESTLAENRSGWHAG